MTLIVTPQQNFQINFKMLLESGQLMIPTSTIKFKFVKEFWKVAIKNHFPNQLPV